MLGLYFRPTSWLTRAAIGTAETPAEPMRGLTFPLVTTYRILPIRRPPTVDRMNANTPSAMIFSVSTLRKEEATMVAPTAVESIMVTMFISAFWTVSDSRAVTPHSRNKLPSIRQPMRGAVEGSSTATNTVTTMGKMIFSVLLTSRVCFITTWRSFLVVSSFINGG